MIGQSVGSDASPLSCFLFRPRKRLEKRRKRSHIPTFPMHRSYGLQHLRHKRPTFAFTSESGYTLGAAQRIAHNGSHGETGGVSDGGAITTLGAFHTFRKPCVARCQNGVLCRFGVLVGDAPEERRKPSEQRCAYARRCSEGVAAPLGCVIFFASAEIAACTPCAQSFLCVRGRGGITTLGALCMFSKRWTAACQKDSFAVF